MVKVQANQIGTDTGDSTIFENIAEYEQYYTIDELPDRALVPKYLLDGLTPLAPVEIEYDAGQSLLQYAIFIPVPDGFTKNARLTYEDVVSATIHNLIPLQTMQLVYVSGVFTGWNITLVGEDNGAFQTLYPSIVTVIS